MTPMKILARALAEEVDGGYRITMESDDGEVFCAFATENQMTEFADKVRDLIRDETSELTEEEEHVSEEQPS